MLICINNCGASPEVLNLVPRDSLSADLESMKTSGWKLYSYTIKIMATKGSYMKSCTLFSYTQIRNPFTYAYRVSTSVGVVYKGSLFRIGIGKVNDLQHQLEYLVKNLYIPLFKPYTLAFSYLLFYRNLVKLTTW